MRWMAVFLLLITGITAIKAQNLQGKWKGYFVANTDILGKLYHYEIEITEPTQQNYKAKSFTQFNAQYTATANAIVVFDKATSLVRIDEQHFESLKINPQYNACLMQNFLNYKNINGHEIMEGTYTSQSTVGQKDCGGGKVYLEKYLPLVAYIKTSPKQLPKKDTSLLISKTSPTKLIIQAEKNSSMVNNNSNESLQKMDIKTSKEEETPEETKLENTANKDFQATPWVLVVRENKLVKKITTHSTQFSIDLYDNGTIDNDTINVYDNKQLIVNKKRLSYKAIHLDFNFTPGNLEEHEVIIVAQNMGTVPPNTALLVLKDGQTRQEYFITSTNKMNAKLVIAYSPPSPN